MSFQGWKKIDKVSIVYKDDSDYKKGEYSKAYIVETGNKSSMESALSWSGYSDKIIETENKDFSIKIVSAAGNSWSQGGKLSFWMCLIQKDGIDPFLVGINSELLCDLILESTLINGEAQEKVFFARKNGQLGVLHEKMSSYEQFVQDNITKAAISKNKTTKWKIGYAYNTLTTSDVMMGYFSHKILTHEWNDHNHNIYKLDFTKLESPLYIPTWKFKEDGFDEFLWYTYYNSDCGSKCPARQEGKKYFDETSDYYETIVKKIEKKYELSKDIDFDHIASHAFAIFKYNPDVTINLLKKAIERYDYIITHYSATNLPEWLSDFDKEWYTKHPEEFNIKKFMHDYEKIIEYNNESFACDTMKDVFTKLIEIAKIEKKKLK